MTNSPPPDFQVREDVLDGKRSFIIEAPAGSGKTELLIQRYLKLLATVDEPESVLAITFTRKAAGEMRHRVLESMKTAAAGQTATGEHERRTRCLAAEVLSRDHQRGWKLLENADRLQVRTIDSVCDSLVRRLPWMAQFGAMPDIVENATPLYERAAQQTIELLGRGDSGSRSIAELLRRLDNNVNEAERLLATMLPCRDQWLRHISSLWGDTRLGADQMKQLRIQLQAALAAAVRHELRSIRELAPAPDVLQELLWLCRFAANNAGENDLLRALHGLKEFPSDDPEHLRCWRALRFLILKADGDLRNILNRKHGIPPGEIFRKEKERAHAFLELMRQDAHSPFLQALARLDLLPQPEYSEEEWQFMEALLRVLPLAAAELREVFRQSGRIDFAEVTQASLIALKGFAGKEVEFAASAPLKHLLVDEYQDTSVTQQELLKALVADWREGDGRTLFLVGDPKQSIYGFRQAEVAIFQQAKQGQLQRLKLHARSLEANFRSQAGLVAWVNQTFRTVLKQDDSARGAVGFGRDAVAVHAALEGEPVSMISVPDDSECSEAEHVRRIIQREQKSDPRVTIGVLVRSRRHLAEIVQELAAAGIRFRAVDIDPLGSRQVVRDLDALARALVHPADRAAWLAVLRAPWCGIELVDLCALCEAGEERTIWQLLQDRRDRLSTNGKIRLDRVRSILAPALAERGRSGFSRLVESAWNALGGPACLPSGNEGDLQLPAAKSYFRLLRESETGGEWLDRHEFESELEKLYAPPAPAEDIHLEVMTVHKAKGLEFDVVILPSLHRATRVNESRLLYWQERVPTGEAELLMAPYQPSSKKGDKSITSYLMALQKERDEQEERRLLYVAATRAKKRTYLLGNPDSQRKGSLLRTLCEVEELSAHFQSPVQAAAVQTPHSEPRRKPITLRRLKLAWQSPAPPEAVRWSSPNEKAAEESDHTFEWVSDPLRHIGTVVHRYLKEIASDGPQHWTQAKIEASAPSIRSALFQLGVVKDLERSVTDVQKALREMLQDSRGQWILAPRPEARNEFEISGVLEGKVYRLRIDRTFVDEHGTRWIIDYKTARHSGGNLEQFLDAQREKYGIDLQRYSRLMNAYDNRPVRLGLYFPLLNGWREVESAVAGPTAG